MAEPRITSQQIKIHQKQADKTADEQTRDTNFDAAAKALLENMTGHKGTGKKVYIETQDGKKTVSDVSVWMNNLDKDKDGIITAKELQEGGGDKYNILKMDADEKTRQKVSADIEAEQLVGGVIGIGKGLKAPKMAWGIAKKYILKYTTKDGLKEMMSNDRVRQYYNQEYWGMDEKSAKANADSRARMREVFQAHNFTEQDFRDMGFSDEQVKYFTQK